jgi:hypothetical protein
MLDSPHDTTPQEKRNIIDMFQYFAKNPIKEALHHRKILPQTNVTSFGRELPKDVGNTTPNSLSRWTIKEV